MTYRGYIFNDFSVGVIIFHTSDPEEIIDVADNEEAAKRLVDSWLNAV